MQIYEKVRSVPENAQKKITGGRLNGMTDINPMWRIKTLTELFGVCGIGWYYTIDKCWVEPVLASDEITAHVQISLFIKDGESWSKPIEGLGGAKYVAKERNGLFVDDDCYKKALTDAISIACKALGFGADIYWDKDATKYSPIMAEENRIEKDGCTKTQIATIIDMASKRNIPLSEVLARAKVDALEELSKADAARFIKVLDKSPAREATE